MPNIAAPNSDTQHTVPFLQRFAKGASRQPLLVGGALIVAGELMFASMGVGVRAVSAELPNALIVFFRNLIALALLAPWLLRPGGVRLATGVPWLHLIRDLAGLGAMYCFFYALAHLPLANAMLLSLTSPLVMPLVGLVLLDETIPPRAWLAVVLGFVGVILMLRPDLAGVSPAALAGLLGGVLAAVAKVAVRRLSRSEPALRIVVYFTLSCALISAVPAAMVWRTPTLGELGWLTAIAATATVGQFFLTRGMATAPAARMGVFGYAAVIFGAAYGWLLWDELPQWGTFAGSLAILAAGLIAGTRGRRSAGSAQAC